MISQDFGRSSFKRFNSLILPDSLNCLSLSKFSKPHFVIKLILFFLSFSNLISVTNWNPSFPRVGQMTFYDPGAGPFLWQNHDLVIIRFYWGDAAKKVKELNPDCILLATNNDLGDLGNEFPDPWYLHYSDGSRVSGFGGQMLNITEYCPVVNHTYGNQQFNAFYPQRLADRTDYTVFDGTFFDTWWAGLGTWFPNVDNIDCDNNGVGDGMNLADARLNKGKSILINNLRNLVPGRVVLGHESPGDSLLNGNGFEFWTNNSDASLRYNFDQLQANQDLGKSLPTVNFCEGSRTSGSIFRWGLTAAMLFDAYHGFDEGTFAHRWSYFYDEYEAEIGYPKGPAREIKPDVWVREFDAGAVITTHALTPQVVSASNFQNGPYYRFRGSNFPLINNGALFDTITLGVFDGILLVKNPTSLVTPVIIDNVPQNATSLDQVPLEKVGIWSDELVSTDGGFHIKVEWGENAVPFIYSPPGNGENKALYKPKIEIPGDYEIFEWHSVSDLFGGKTQTVATAVPVSVVSENFPLFTGKIDQSINGGQWNSLGIFHLAKGLMNYVEISNLGALGYVKADAVQFVLRKPDASYPPLAGVSQSQDMNAIIHYDIALKNSPNPFNPQTVISFTLTSPARVVLTVFDQLGSKVSELVSGQELSGRQQFRWDASAEASGIYFFELRMDRQIYRLVGVLIK